MWILELYKEMKLGDFLVSEHYHFLENYVREKFNGSIINFLDIDNCSYIFNGSEKIGVIEKVVDFHYWGNIFKYIGKNFHKITGLEIGLSSEITFSRQKNIDFSEEKIKKLSDIIDIKCEN